MNAEYARKVDAMTKYAGFWFDVDARKGSWDIEDGGKAVLL
jgi:hypothetical protein